MPETPSNETETFKILARLVQLSSERKLNWEEWDSNNDEYKASSSKFNYYVRSRDNDGTAPFHFELYTTTADTPSLVVESAEPSTSDLLRSLYTYARRSASGFWDGLAVEVLRDLGSLDDDGF